MEYSERSAAALFPWRCEIKEMRGRGRRVKSIGEAAYIRKEGLKSLLRD
jgi:hypothetical protein